MGTIAARQARHIAEHVEIILAIELLCAVQGMTQAAAQRQPTHRSSHRACDTTTGDERRPLPPTRHRLSRPIGEKRCTGRAVKHIDWDTTEGGHVCCSGDLHQRSL